uniref:P5 protein n=1 Tax=Pepper vein yellows virus TaxID=909827 RepID=A0A5P8D1W5_9VIRU|nr:P5 protein [Pepper vein yellows virus]QQZ00020.1 P5 protein [Pepper vein yellows virus]
MYKWEDEKWDKVNLQAGYSRNDRRCMETYLTIPADKGKFHVYLEADGEFVVKHIGGDLDGSWLGNIAYDVSQRGWTIGNYKGCKIKNFQTNTTFVAGHPDAKMNGKTFDSARAVEVDWFASFELECDDEEGSWMIYPPPIQKDASYNYTVSYGNYTEKYCEWGAISVSIDEDNEGYAPRRIPRKGEMAWSDPEKDYSEDKPQKENWNTEPLDTGKIDRERQLVKTPSPDVSDSGSELGADPIPQDLIDKVNKGEALDPMQQLEYDKYRFQENIIELSESQDQTSEYPKLPPPVPHKPLPSGRTEKYFKPSADLLEAWDKDHFNPGYTKEEVAAATIISHGSIADGRDALEERDNKIQRARVSWSHDKSTTSPSIAKLREKTLEKKALSSGSLRRGSEAASSLGGGSITGGTLKPKKTIEEEIVSKLTTTQRLRYEQLKARNQTAANNYLWSVEVPPEKPPGPSQFKGRSQL